MPCTNCALTSVSTGNGYRLTIDGLVDFNGTEINSAVITWQIYDSDDTAVVGATGNMTAVGTGGDYFANISAAIIALLTSGNEYTVIASGTATGVEFALDVSFVVA